ncbi:hypothetical protein CSOJ01_13247 [Colletotrichum sojae]|uniref:Secreted LysM effector LysM C-terminal domain-containing protein n=1 Tax=Colletotrichum sojae TaxID=2175907 RepID=A0A8H6MLD8_9PEZI|nr:hypothetical protein CSOJ01_13247 [Colletotrichum sojae]
MHFSTVTVILAGLCATAQAWEVVAYDNTDRCDANDNTRYRSITGAPGLTRCFTFDQDMPGTGCREYIRGGAANQGCISGSLLPSSVLLSAGRCVLFDQPGCQGRYSDTNRPVDHYCLSFARDNWGKIRSFSCSGWT